jgi:hypothetical protein
MRTVVDDKSYMVIFCDGDNSYYIILEFIFDIFVIPLLLLTRTLSIIIFIILYLQYHTK